MREDPDEVALEGVLRRSDDGKQFVLRLASARCVVGMARGSVLTEVVVVSDGFDLRPLVDRRVRVRGRAIGDATDLEGPALVVVARSAEDLPRREGP